MYGSCKQFTSKTHQKQKKKKTHLKIPTEGYLCAIYVFIMSPFTQSGDVTMADKLDPHFPLAALSLFDKGQQTLPSQ